MKKLMLILACAALPMVAFADTPAKTTKHKGHKTAASPAPEASPSASPSPAATSTTTKSTTPAKKASPAPKPSASPAAK